MEEWWNSLIGQRQAREFIKGPLLKFTKKLVVEICITSSEDTLCRISLRFLTFGKEMPRAISPTGDLVYGVNWK